MQSRDSAAGTLRLCVAALLFLSRLASGATTRSSRQGSKPSRNRPGASNEELDAPAPPQTLASPWSGDFWTRSQLTGDWFGSRTKLAENGFSFFGDLTQYYQGVTTGGQAQRLRLRRPRRLSDRHRHRESGTLGRRAPRSPRRDAPGARLQRDRRCSGTVELCHGTSAAEPKRDGAHWRAVHAGSLGKPLGLLRKAQPSGWDSGRRMPEACG